MKTSSNRARALPARTLMTAAVAAALTIAGLPAHADLVTGGQELVVSSTTYNDAGFSVGAALPLSTTTLATAGSAFCQNADCSASVWNNSLKVTTGVPGSGANDANFGTSSAISLLSVNANTGHLDGSLDVTALAASQNLKLVTSFASKSELALNVTPDGKSVTFMGYNTTLGKLDISNSNTPGIIEPGNTDTQTATYRGVAQLNVSNKALQYTTSNAYAGNNGRAAVLAANGQYYMAGNAGNGNGSAAVTAATGIQLLTPGNNATTATPGTTELGAYNITQNGYAADKAAKDSNFRGLTVFNNTVYVSKGSGGNGINTVYQVGAAGALPTGTSNPITVLPGFSTALAKPADKTVLHPFGLFFANASTLYVGDEGSGAATDFGASPTTNAGGLQKWSLVSGVWTLDYTLKGSLIGHSYTTSDGAGHALTTTADGLRNLTGRVNGDGTVSIFAVTSTAGSVLGDAGADPNQLVSITDTLANTTAAGAAGEDFTVLQTAALGQALRGVALAPVPEPTTWVLMVGGLLAAVGMGARRRS